MSTAIAPLFHELVAALKEIAREAPQSEPAVYENIARAALAKVDAGQPLIPVSPSMIENAQDAFIADWLLGASPKAAITSAVLAAVNHINNSVKERAS